MQFNKGKQNKEQIEDNQRVYVNNHRNIAYLLGRYNGNSKC